MQVGSEGEVARTAAETNRDCCHEGEEGGYRRVDDTHGF